MRGSFRYDTEAIEKLIRSDIEGKGYNVTSVSLEVERNEVIEWSNDEEYSVVFHADANDEVS
ncbi:MAG: hypothetical protein ACW99G_19070 [Candidatus Thorarchaeota archaeon]|jgi:hypothetical protein